MLSLTSWRDGGISLRFGFPSRIDWKTLYVATAVAAASRKVFLSLIILRTGDKLSLRGLSSCPSSCRFVYLVWKVAWYYVATSSYESFLIRGQCTFPRKIWLARDLWFFEFIQNSKKLSHPRFGTTKIVQFSRACWLLAHNTHTPNTKTRVKKHQVFTKTAVAPW